MTSNTPADLFGLDACLVCRFNHLVGQASHGARVIRDDVRHVFSHPLSRKLIPRVLIQE